MVNTFKGFVNAVNKEQDIIEMEMDIGKKIFRIRMTNKVALIVAVGATAVAITIAPATPAAPPAGVYHLTALPVSTIIAFGPAAPAAIALAVAAKDARFLLKVRNYDIVKNGEHYVAKKKK